MTHRDKLCIPFVLIKKNIKIYNILKKFKNNFIEKNENFSIFSIKQITLNVEQPIKDCIKEIKTLITENKCETFENYD